ncbi:MAG: DUF222 domain-containing protein [Dermatophilaceae bacterium]
MTILPIDHIAVGLSPAGARSFGAVSTRGVVAGHARLVHAVLDKVHARLAFPESVVTSADIEEVERIARRVEAVRLALVARVDRQQSYRGTGHSSTAAWVASTTRAGAATAQRDVVLATALDSGLELTRTALQAGEMSGRSAGIIASAMSKLPGDLPLPERDRVEASLVRDARRLDPPKLHRAALVALAAADRSAQEVAGHVEAQLADEERRAYAVASVTIHDQGDGTTKLAAVLPTLTARTLHKVLQTMTSPRRDHLRKGAEAALADGQTPAGLTTDGSVAAGSVATRSHDGRNGDWPSLDWAQRRGRALVDLIEHLDTERLTGKVASTVIVTMTLEQALGAAKAAHLQATVHAATGTLLELTPTAGATTADTGVTLSAAAARRTACNAGILPAVLGGPSQVLDLGRQERFFTDPQRTALAVVYNNCAAQDCDRPYAWCELHHEDPWSRGGRSDLSCAVPLCGYHHRLIHDPAYHHELTRTRGAKTVRFRRRS